MPIISSTYVIDAHVQADGGHYVRETLTDSTGRVHHYHYHLPAGQGDAEVVAIMAAHEASLNVQLAEAEAERVADGSGTALSLTDLTEAQLCFRLWTKIRAAKDAGQVFEYHRLMDRLYTLQQAGSVSVAASRVAFNAVYERSLNASQFNNTAVPRMAAISARYQAMVGEADL